MIIGYIVSWCYLYYHPKIKSNDEEDIENNNSEFKTRSEMTEQAEKGFRPLMVLTACVVSFAHGTNDVSNAIGPFTAISEIYFTHNITRSPSPLWILMYGGTGIIVGLYLYGHRVMHTIGDNIFTFSYSKGFSSQLATAITVLTATLLGMSVATTHCLIGSITGMAVVEGINKMNFGTIKTIIVGWIVTMPASAIFSIIYYSVLSYIVG